MSPCVQPPDLDGSYAVSADWLELLCLLRESGMATADDLTGSAQILEDRAASSEPTSPEDAEDLDIVDHDQERVLDTLAEEIARREKDLDVAYPFKMTRGQRSIVLIRTRDVDDDAVMRGREVYRACLLISALRSGLVDGKRAGIQVDPKVGRLFQICATIALAGYVGGDAYEFGWPRPDGTSFLKAVQRLTQLLKAGETGNELPPGTPGQIKDGGIDVVAWRDHADHRPSKLIVCGQCASGMNWEDKSVIAKLKSFGGYYTQRPSEHWLPALLMPFPLYMEKENSNQLTTDASLNGFYLRMEAEMGLILDRSRIVRCFIQAIPDIQPTAKKALESLHEVVDWCAETTNSIGSDV